MIHLAVFLAALIAAFALSPAARRLSPRLGIVAEPGGRRRHTGRVPKLGGLPLLGGWLVGVILAYAFLPVLGPDAATPDDFRLLQGVVIGGLVIFAGGLIDDRWELPPWANFLIQAGAAIIAMAHSIFILLFTNPFTGDEVLIEPRLLGLLFSFFWIAGMINAVNFLDGLDGLASGVGAIAALLFAWHSYELGQIFVSLFPLALAGALIGFLPFNFYPARLFLGTAGAYLLGYQLATLSILAPAKVATALLVLAVPIVDVGWQIINRLRHGQSPFHGDRGHLHFRLSDGGLPTPLIALGYYAVALAFGLVAIFATGLTKLIVLLLLGVLLLALLMWLERREGRVR